MDCIFNELSIEEVIADKTTAINLMSEFILVCKEINRLSIKKKIKLRAIEDFRQRVLFDDYTIHDWLTDKNVDHFQRSLLNTLLDTPTINEEVIRETEYLENNFEYRENLTSMRCEGLAVAYASGKMGALSVSLNSHPRWNKHEIELTCVSNDQQKSVTIKHVSQQKHVDYNKCFILIIKSGEISLPTLTNPFPNLVQSNKLVNNDWSKFKQDLDNHSDQKLSLIQKMADSIARINGYAFNKTLSSLNKKKSKSYRKIYQGGSDNNRVYLSVDFEKGAFELCNNDGQHQGEYKFNGDKSRDKKGDHNISITK
jgi:hypothetical protein